MPLTKQIHELLAGSRVEARREIVELFLNEQCGTGKGELSSKYEYKVEQYENYSILLKRPAALNKGFDFVVHIDGMYFKSSRRHTNPSHNDIIQTLQQVKSSVSEVQYENIEISIRNVYNLQEFYVSSISDIYFADCDNQLRPIVIIILAIKWLFIEQDVTYWNWSGRAMLMNGLEENALM
ncbi:MAG: hypothetical protein KBG30_12755 [Bacteroidales bacterium]|jgi:hypothetical protein|nr:hypothetical protein [Bacteroidales bacterium]